MSEVTSATGPRDRGRERVIRAVRQRMAEMDPPLSVTALAARAGVKRDTIDLFLRGDRWPQQAKQAAIERALGWTVGRIAELTTEGPHGLVRSDDLGGDDMPRSRRDLVDFLDAAERDLSDTQRDLLEAEIRAYALRRAMEIRREF